VNILHVSDCYLPRMGGIERQVHDLALRQHGQGHRVHIATSVAGDGSDAGPVRIIRPEPGRGGPTAVRYATFGAGADVVRAGDYDIVHVHASSMSPMAYRAAMAASHAGIPTVITVHSLWDYASPIFSASDRLLRWSRWPITWSTVSSVAAAALRKHLGPRTPITILPNAVDDALWRVQPRPHAPDRVVAVSVMRLAARKRPQHLLAMLRRARQQVPAHIELEALIVGDGPRRAALQRHLDRYRMPWVRLVGPRTHAEIREIYTGADLFIAPATLESFGIAALEARCAGLPVVAHAISGVRDFVRDGREGLLATSDEHMAGCITRLAACAPLRARIAEHNRRTAPAMGWPEVLQRCQELYDSAGLPRPAGVPRPTLASRLIESAS